MSRAPKTPGSTPGDMTPEEFFIWCEAQDDRYELVDGRPVLLHQPIKGMAGASDAHDRIVTNLIVTLGQQLRGTPCWPRTADQAIRTKIKQVRRPDVTIDCSEVDPKAFEARNPVAVFEIISPSTRHSDLQAKLSEYLRRPKLRSIIYIDPARYDVVVHRRGASGEWTAETFQTGPDVVTLEGVQAQFSLNDAYAGVPLDDASAGA
jgi:Uma2 family endonuclease